MKSLNISLIAILLLSFVSICNTSCQKDVAHDPLSKQVPEEIMTKKPDDPGFVENAMVIYWNQKASAVLENFNPPPAQSRLFAMIQIAVHDALNSIKPKFERYALLNEREQFANPDAAVASAAYWAIKGLGRQGSFPVDTWYTESLATIPNGTSKDLGIILGQHAAEAIIANRANDGFTQVIQTSTTTPPDGDEPG